MSKNGDKLLLSSGEMLDNLKHRYDDLRSSVVNIPSVPESMRALGKGGKKKKRSKRDSRPRVAFFRYGYYDVAFRYFIEQVLDADFVQLPEATRRTLELGTLNSNDYVCAPFKHILGDYIESLELGADTLVQFTGPCRLGYYGELQQKILRDMGYEFTMMNFAEISDVSMKETIDYCKKMINPNLVVSKAIKRFVILLKMIESLDTYNDEFLENAGFEIEPGSFRRAREEYFDNMRGAVTLSDVLEVQKAGLKVLRGIPLKKPVDPIRVGLVGEYFTAVDPHSNLHIEDKFQSMGVSMARMMTMTNRNLLYNESNIRAQISEYVDYDMGPTSSLTIAAAKKYAELGFDGVVHMKSAGCTPEIDVMPVLQRLSRDYGIPILYLSYDSQTSDTGLDTRLEAFYDMISMRKAR